MAAMPENQNGAVAENGAGCEVASATLDGSAGGPFVEVEILLGRHCCDNEQDGSRATIENLKFPLSYLRDNCSSNFHETTLQRLTPMCHAVLNAAASKVEVDSCSLLIHWQGEPIRTAAFPDRFLAQESRFSASWLLQHRLDPATRGGFEFDLLKKIQPFTATEFARQRIFDYTELMESDASLLDFIRLLWSRGLVMVDGLPHWWRGLDEETQRTVMNEGNMNTDFEKVFDEVKEQGVSRLQHRLAFPRQTNYGIRFHVKAKSGANNQAYTSQALALHTDLPFYNQAPDIQMLHCVAVNGGGKKADLSETETGDGTGSAVGWKSGDEFDGASIFSDGVAAALRLRQRDPAHYEVLSKKRVQYSDWSLDASFELHKDRTIITDHGAESTANGGTPIVSHVHLNEGVRCHLLNSCKPSEVNSLYAALLSLQDTLLEEDLKMQFRLRPGQMVVWNNNRVLHGRNGFAASGQASEGLNQDRDGSWAESVVERHDSYRHMIGGYVDWDDTLSTMRVLEQKYSV